MKVSEIHNLAIKLGIENDFRGKDGIKKLLAHRKEEFDKLSVKDKEEFDKETLSNPYADSVILNLVQDQDVKKVLVGIDISVSEILMAKELGKIDLIIAHHPLGKGLSHLADVMELQCDVLERYGVPINIAEGLLQERISEVARGIGGYNHQRAVDGAKILGFNLICLHTVCDNLAANFLKEKIEKANPERLGDLVDLLKEILEYKEAIKIGAGPKIFVGDLQRRCGKIALTEITGGTEGSPKIYEKMAQAGIGTIVGMHMEKEHYEQAREALVNVVIAGHISSDSLGVNLFLDELDKIGIEITPCSGLTRISRVSKNG